MRLVKQLTFILLIAYVGSAQSQHQWIRQLSNIQPQVAPVAPVTVARSDNTANFLRIMQERTRQKNLAPQINFNPVTQRQFPQRSPPSMPSMPTMPVPMQQPQNLVTPIILEQQRMMSDEQGTPRFGSNLAKFEKQQRELQEMISQREATRNEQRMQREQQERERERSSQEALENHRLMLDAHRREMDAKQRENEEHTQQLFADQQNSFQDQQQQLQEQLQAQRDTQRGLEQEQMAMDMGVESRIAKPSAVNARMLSDGSGRMMSDEFNDGMVSNEQAEKDAEIRRVDSERLANEMEQRQREKESDAESVAKWSEHQMQLEQRLEEQQARLGEQQMRLEEQRLEREEKARERDGQHLNDLEEQRLAMEAHRMELENHRKEEDARLMDRDREVQDSFQSRQDAMLQRLRDQENSLREQEAMQKEEEMEQRHRDMNGNSRIITRIDMPCGEENQCLNSGTCEQTQNGTKVCVCNKPWTGVKCELVWENPCTETQLRSSEFSQFADPWNTNNYIICTDINIYHSLPCAPGTYFNPIYAQCTRLGHNPAICPYNHCKNDAVCITTDNNKFECECKLGFSGDFCEVNINECITEGGYEKCGIDNTCVDQLNGYFCKCANDMVGLDCEDTVKNPCTVEAIEEGRDLFVVPDEMEGRTFLQCTSENSFVVSKCQVGLFWHQENMACTLERPTVKSGMCMGYPCLNAGECRDVNGTEFECMCKGGYTGELCETMIDSCASNPCQNGGRCLAFAGGYTCACADKIIDECCCHGLKNPCPQTSMIIPGLNNYYPHLFPDRYIHCDFDGRAFSRKCSNGLIWSQRSLSCLPDSFVLINPMKVKTKTVDLPVKMSVKPIEDAIMTSLAGTAMVEATTINVPMVVEDETTMLSMVVTENKPIEDAIIKSLAGKAMQPMAEETTINVPMVVEDETTTMDTRMVETSTMDERNSRAEERRKALMRRVHTKNLRFVTRPRYEGYTTQ